MLMSRNGIGIQGVTAATSPWRCARPTRQLASVCRSILGCTLWINRTAFSKPICLLRSRWHAHGRHLDVIWTSFGHHMDVILEVVLDIILDVIWTSFGRHFRRHFRRHLDIFWTSFGHLLDIIWTSFWRSFWTSFGHLLDIIWTSFWRSFWTSFGHHFRRHLDVIWTSFGRHLRRHLDVIWASFWRSFWTSFGPGAGDRRRFWRGRLINHRRRVWVANNPLCVSLPIGASFNWWNRCESYCPNREFEAGEK